MQKMLWLFLVLLTTCNVFAMDTGDLETIASYWLDGQCSAPNWCDGADLDRSGHIDLVDFCLMSQRWLHGPRTAQNWMRDLSDAALLSQLSIPGTHDSGARFEPLTGTAKCQDLTIAEQLNIGIRFLDIRCRHIDNAFTIHHGQVYQNMNFDDVLDAVIGFLNAHPSECIIMSVKEEYNASNVTRTFEQTFDTYVAKNPAKWHLGQAVPRLGEVRGKIVLFRRFSASSAKGINATNWPDNTTFTSGFLRVQDYYNDSDSNAKWNAIQGLLNESTTANAATLHLNFTSGYVPGLFNIPNIRTISNAINPKLESYFNANPVGRYGILPMDFANATRAALIYNTNYDDHAAIANGVYKLINAGSGKVLEVAGGSTADDANIQQWTDNGGNHQQWMLTSLGGGFYQLTAYHSTKAADVANYSTANNGNVLQWPWYAGNNQIWKIIGNADGTYRLVNKHSGLCLYIAGGSLNNGANACQYQWTGDAAMKWYIVQP